MRAAPLLTLTLTLTGCLTAPPKDPVRVPAVLDPLFQPCIPGDGATTLQAFTDGSLLGSAQAEWVAKPTGDWDVEVSNAAGQTVLTVARRGAEMTASGPLSARLPHLAVRPSGYLDVDGHLVAIKADEVPCLLGFTLPRGWLPYAAEVASGNQEATVFFADGTRDVTVTARHLGSRTQEATCATVSWPKLLFLRQELVWCAHLTGHREGTLSGLRDYSLKWVKIDER